jgi:hypothetical protein
LVTLLYNTIILFYFKNNVSFRIKSLLDPAGLDAVLRCRWPSLTAIFVANLPKSKAAALSAPKCPNMREREVLGVKRWTCNYLATYPK